MGKSGVNRKESFEELFQQFLLAGIPFTQGVINSILHK